MPRIELTTELPASPEDCFEMSLSVDAHRESMSDSGERVVGGVTSGVMRLGDTVTWRAKHFGIPFTMTSVISVYDAPPPLRRRAEVWAVPALVARSSLRGDAHWHADDRCR